MEGTEQELVDKLKALSNPIRLKMIASLNETPKNVYTLAKEMGLSYPLAYLHLKGLRKLDLVEEVREVEQAEGLPSKKFYAPTEFEIVLSPESIGRVFRKRGEKDE